MYNTITRTQVLTRSALFIAVTAVCSWISIPIPGTSVPINLATFAVILAGLMLGSRDGAIAMLVFLALGAIGVPVFHSFTGGMGIVFGPTGGFLIGFIFLAAIAGFFVEKFPAKIYMHVVGMIIGMAICYIFGTAWLAGQLGMSFVAALSIGVIPYLPGDTAKIIIAIIAGPQIRKAVSRFM